MRISDWSSDVCSSDLHNRLTGGIEAYYHRIAFVEADAEGAKGIAEMCDENGIRACLNVRFDKLDKVAASVVHRAVGLGPVAHERRNSLDSSKSEPRRFAAPTHRAGKHVADRDAQIGRAQV